MSHPYKFESLGRSAFRAVRSDMSLADFTFFVTLEGNEPEPAGQLPALEKPRRPASFSFKLPGLGQSVYGFSPERMVYELLAYSVDSSD